MPYKFQKEHIKLSEEQDRRVKLTKDDKEFIRAEYRTGLFSLNNLAKKYNVSKKCILLIVNPDSFEKAREYSKEYSKTHRNNYNHTEAMRKTRQYKAKLYKEGKLK